MNINKPKALVIITPGFPANEDDSTCLPPQQTFVKALKEVNPQLEIIVLTFQYPFFSEEYTWNGIRVISYGHPANSRLSRFFTSDRVLQTLKKLNKVHRIIGLLSFWLGKAAVIGNKFAKKNQLKHYTWLLGQDAKAGNKYFYKIKPGGASLIAISDFIANGLNKNYGVLPHHIIPVGVDTGLFSTNNTLKDIDILGAGSLIPLKQYAIFIEVVQALTAYFPGVKTVICGDGPEMGKLREMINSTGLQNNILLAGRQSHPEVLAYMERSKILLHPSNYEGFSTVCLEALYARAKVVSFVQPMSVGIENWRIAVDKENMVQLAKALLQDTQLTYNAVLPYTVQNNAKAITKLFD
jgi:glycosyltransferase involved in cell wall biosynthesis